MKFTLYDNVKTFYADVNEVLLAREAQNMLILGNLIIGYEGKDIFGWRDPANWVMATVAVGGEVRLVGLMTPPFGMTLYAADNKADSAAVKCLVDGLIAADITVPGVVTEKSLAKAFAETYCDAKEMTHKVTFSQRIYELNAVNPEIPKIGHFRAANEQDLSFSLIGPRALRLRQVLYHWVVLSAAISSNTAIISRAETFTYWKTMAWPYLWPKSPAAQPTWRALAMYTPRPICAARAMPALSRRK